VWVERWSSEEAPGVGEGLDQRTEEDGVISGNYAQGIRTGFDTSRPVESFVEVVRGVLLTPQRFFSGLGPPESLREQPQIIFAIICGYISFPLSVLASPLDPLTARGSDPFSGFLPLLGRAPVLGIVLALGFLILLPLFVILGLYIGTALQHLFVFLFVRQRRGYWGTFPAVAYGTSAVSLITWVPVLGYLASLYGVYVLTVALRDLHGTTTLRALLAAALPALLSLSFTVATLLFAPAGT
jgi:hypothetical protein